MNDSQPLPEHGTVSIDEATVLEPGLITASSGEVVGARVWTWSTDGAGASRFDSSIVGASPQELERLSFAIREAANLLRRAGA